MSWESGGSGTAIFSVDESTDPPVLVVTNSETGNSFTMQTLSVYPPVTYWKLDFSEADRSMYLGVV